ncbi:SIT4 phosphatase-associated protein-domain-containing protein [Pyronema omphalodes]|nr:SIT4 phosphatase-associated protein-domain-containing protein [Pyronema omphalodes]
MFWRFGSYANISSLDTILDKPDVTLEELLNEPDLLQEVKHHNTKLIEFLRDEKVLRKLLECVIAPKPAPIPPPTKKEGDAGEEDPEAAGERMAAEAEREKNEKNRLKYAYKSCEVLSSEAWSLVEALMQNLDHMKMFWSFLERDAPLDPLQASYFTKVNETLLDKKTEEMMAFVKSIDGIVPRILKHVDCPMIMDLLLKIISMEKSEGGAGIVDWLHSQNLIPHLLSFLSSDYPASTQTASGDFIKALITISANASQNEQSCIGPNDLTRQLVSQECIEKLLGDMLKGGNPLTVGVGIIIEVIRKNNSDYDPDIGTGVDSIPSSRDPIYLGTLLRLFASHVPDFMKLVLSHGAPVADKDGNVTETRRQLKVAFGGSIEPLGFDRFKTCELMAELLHCSNMGLLNEKGGERYVKERDAERERLKAERRQALMNAVQMGGFIPATEGVLIDKAPLQVQNGEVEMSDDGINEDEFEDVLVSGMLDDPKQDTDMHDVEHVFHDDQIADDEDPFADQNEEAEEDIPVASSKPTEEKSLDEVAKSEPVFTAALLPAPEAHAQSAEPVDTRMGEAAAATGDAKSNDTTEQPKDEAVTGDEASNPAPKTLQIDDEDNKLPFELPVMPTGPATEGQQATGITPQRLNAELPPLPPAKPEEEGLMDLANTPDIIPTDDETSVHSISSLNEYHALIESDHDGNPVVGDYLKMMFVEHKIVPTILDFFFRFPWNNFLHNVVYDVVQQVFNGPLDRGFNRALAVDLFVTGRITERIVEGQKMSDKFEAERKMRLGYMGHLTLVAEEVVKFADRLNNSQDIMDPKVMERANDPVWIEYVDETLAATRERDNAILGGVRPDMHIGPRISGMGAQSFSNISTNAGGNLTLGSETENIDLGNVNGGASSGGREGGGLLSGFGSSSDEEDDDMEHDDEDDEVARLGLSGSSDQVGDLHDLTFDNDFEDLFDEDITFH